MKFHTAANLFPLLVGDDYEALKEDIREHGQHEPISLYGGAILDGRNRWRCCEDLGREPTTRELAFESDSAALSWVVSMNLHRRHLTPSQRAMVGVAMLPLLEAEAKQRKVASGKSTGRGHKKVTDNCPEPNLHEKESREIAAKAVGVSGGSISKAKRVQSEAPEYAEQITSGAMTLNTAMIELKERERVAERAEAADQIAAAPTIEQSLGAAKFSTIVVDPPWDFAETNGGYWGRGTFGRADQRYGSMTIAELAEYPVGNYAADDAHIYLWVPNRVQPLAYQLLDAWGFRYSTVLTWCKPSIGMGQHFRQSTEQILFGVRGSLPLKRRDCGTWFEAPRGPDGHSSKPDEAYKLIESCSPGPYLDIFSRRQREGWTCCGGQLQAKESAL